MKPERLSRFLSGTCFDAYKELGSHKYGAGFRFAVWAPNATAVSLVGDFNAWDTSKTPMKKTEGGIWTVTLREMDEFQSYKYAIFSPSGCELKADPYAFHAETRPSTASKTYNERDYTWGDRAWMNKRKQYNPYQSPISIYEMHLGSWKLDEKGRLYTYERMADEIVPYIQEMGYTHVQLLPVMEHPLDISWGYQVTGFFAPTSRFGTPAGLKTLIDRFHQAGIGVLLDFVPAHFPKDAFALGQFDGTPLYEGPDPIRSQNPSWGTYMFDLGRPEVASFILSSALYWLKEFHADGLRVDAVSFMLYLDYGRADGAWRPNVYGGRENLESIAFLRRMNETIYQEVPGVIIAAEEATAYPMVTKPTYMGGLGFGFKWNMGWMHDTLDYMQLDPIYRRYHHDKLTFSMYYAFSENYILPFSHDEVVHGKHSLLDKMPGDLWQKFASLRALYGYMYAHPGKKLLFMGGEFGQFIEWNETGQLDWFLLLYERHPNIKTYVAALNRFYKAYPQLYSQDSSWQGFTWCDANNAAHSIFSFLRFDEDGNCLLCVINLTPNFWPSYRLGLPVKGTLREVFNSDLELYGGSGKSNGDKTIYAIRQAWNGQPYSAELLIPPLSATYYTLESYVGFNPRKRPKRQRIKTNEKVLDHG